jgi:hypothetical protein
LGHKETPLQKECLDYLARLQGACFTRTPVLKLKYFGRWIHAGRVGWGDITGVYRGVPVMIECKSPGGKTDRERERSQIEIRAEWRAAGGTAFIIEYIDELVAAIKSIDESKKMLAGFYDLRKRA